MIGMGRPGETVDAAMLAAAIGIDRTVEGDVGRIIAGDDAAGLFDLNFGAERRQVFQALPAIIDQFAGNGLETSGWVERGPPPAAAIDLDAQT